MYQSNDHTINNVTTSLVNLIANVKLTNPAQPVDEDYMTYFKYSASSSERYSASSSEKCYACFWFTKLLIYLIREGHQDIILTIFGFKLIPTNDTHEIVYDSTTSPVILVTCCDC